MLIEARQLVVGVINARVRGDVTDTRFLLAGWFGEVRRNGYSDPQGWSWLFTAAVVWATQLAVCHAEHTGVSIEQAVQELGAATAEWAVHGGG